MIKDAEKTLIASGATPQEISLKLVSIKSEFSTSMQVMQGLIGQTVMGAIASLIIGFFLRTKTTNKFEK